MSLPDVVVDEDGAIAIESARPARHMVLPGFVNAHSHAFQRCLRGRVEHKTAGREHDDFWAWRESMYAAANTVTVDDLRALSRWCFRDMVRAGVTAVGEFHYLHHVSSDPLDASRAVVDAAHDAGLHITLLETAYARAGHGRPATPGQQRFIFESVEAFLFHVDTVQKRLAGPRTTVGVALHSVRACPRSWIEAVAAYARAAALPLHVHACEQRRELVECREEHGMSPIALLDACGALSPRTTLVHATHLDDDDIRLIAASGASVCLTPSTERNLGDGLARIKDLFDAGVPLCVGSDSHARIDMVDEARSVEDHERLRTEKRTVLVKPGGRLAHTLMPIATKHGAHSLGLLRAPGSATVAMPVEGRAFGAAVGLDAFFIGGSSKDVGFVMDVDGKVVVDGDRFDELDHDIEARAFGVLQKWET